MGEIRIFKTKSSYKGGGGPTQIINNLKFVKNIF